MCAAHIPTTNVSLETFWELVAANPDKRLEYHDGVVIENMAGGSLRHAAIGMNCGNLLNNALQGDSLVLSADVYVKVASGGSLFLISA